MMVKTQTLRGSMTTTVILTAVIVILVCQAFELRKNQTYLPSESPPSKRSSRGSHPSSNSTTTKLLSQETIAAHSPLNEPLNNSTGHSSTTIPITEEVITRSPFHNSNTSTSFNQSFTDLLPRSVYFDSRHRDGRDNATVILVQVLKTALKEKSVVGCGVDDRFTNDFHFQVLRTFVLHVHKYFSSLTHDQAMLTCYDLPAHQGSRVFVLYKDKTGKTLKIEAEKRLYIPTGRVISHSPVNKLNSSVLVCTTVYGTPPWLREWLVYQKTIGVDFIHIYAQESFIAEGGANNSVLQSYLKSGYAKLDVWKAYLNESQDFYHQQPLLYVDCIYRYRTEFDYALLYDTDDFFVPVIPGETDIHYYVNKFFQDEKIAAIPFKWIDYYPDCGLTTRPENIKDGNVTKHLAFREGHWKYLKSMYKLSGIVEIQIHDVVTTIPGYIRYGTVPNVPINWMLFVPPEIAYVAHNRKNIKPSDEELLHQCELLQEKL